MYLLLINNYEGPSPIRDAAAVELELLVMFANKKRKKEMKKREKCAYMVYMYICIIKHYNNIITTAIINNIL